MVFLGTTGPLLVATARTFTFVHENSAVRKLEHTFGEIELLTGCPDGKHFAFWSRKEERFCLLCVNGIEVWSKRIDTDKATPHRIFFSTAGDGLACIDDYDGAYRLHFFQLQKDYEQTFGPSQSPIATNERLSHFIEVPFGLRTEKPCKLPVLDRHRRVHYSTILPFSDWNSVSLLPSGYEAVFLRTGKLSWSSFGPSTQPQASRDLSCLQLGTECELHCSSNGNLVLLRKDNIAVLILRKDIWFGQDIRDTLLQDQMAFVLLNRGAVYILNGEGIYKSFPPPADGRQVWAVGYFDNKMKIVKGVCSSRDAPIDPSELRIHTLDL